jgi:hypothetical protein
MKIGMIVTLFLVCVAGAILGHAFLTPPPAHAALADDRSPSVRRNCAGLRQEAEKVAVASNGFAETSTVTLLAIGRDRLNPEPERVFDKPFPVESDRVFDNDPGAFEKQRKDYFAAFQKSCETSPESFNSPVLRLVQAGIAHLRSRGCAAKRPCFLTVHSDLEDDSAPKLREAIARAARGLASKTPVELAASIDNAGIRVQFCGLSEIKPRRSARHAAPDTLANLWSGLFTHAELVSFQPYCGE